ncbi:MAG TPA: SIMPL domain-containing protein [Rhizomicrobium sp.]|nr:SIMPL domain-containing protein [Rhizomicrobium sp.]
MRSLALAFSLALLAAGPTSARAADQAPMPRLLTVSGLGEAKAVPDRATLSTGVVTQGRNAAAALAANARAMNAVFAALKAAGIADKNIQTSSMSVSPQYSDAKPGVPPKVVGYEVSNNVSVTVDGLDKLGATIDALVAAGSNQIDGPSFSIADPKPLLAVARAEAVADATERAQAYAKAAGVTLGPIQSIGEGASYSPPMPMSRMAFAAKDAPTPIAAGEQSVSASVTITWEIR